MNVTSAHYVDHHFMQVVREKFEAHKEGMEILSLDEDELKEAIPQGSAVQESHVVVQLRKLMDDVGRKHREDYLQVVLLDLYSLVS